MMNNTQKSTSFMMYTVNIPKQHLWKGLISSYMGNYDYTGDDSWGDYLSLLYSAGTINETQIEAFRASKNYIHEYDPEPGKVMFVFRIFPKMKKEVVIPFLEGKYSQIDRKYVEENFNKFIGNNCSTNWLILNKDKSLREFWQKELNMSLPLNAEVWSRPLKENEIYNYEDFLVSKELEVAA